MGYASQQGRVRVNSSSPAAAGQCDRCGFWYNFRDLRRQDIVAGAAIVKINILVCCECYDIPNENLLAITLPSDPDPIINARVPDFIYEEAVQPGQTGPYGQPVGLDQNAIMPLNNGMAYGAPLPVLSVSSNGTMTINVTCSAPHNLQTNAQISAEGLALNEANGFYSVTVLTATAFTYQTFSAVAPEGLLTPTSRIVTALIGLPRGYDTIPQVGP